jgi:hypothetical protein
VPQLVGMTKRLLGVDGVGLMLVDAQGALRWAVASDQQAEQLQQAQEELAQGPCTDAFWQRAPVPVRDVTGEGAQQIAVALLGASFRAALSVPLELAGGRSARWTPTRGASVPGTRARSAPCRPAGGVV